MPELWIAFVVLTLLALIVILMPIFSHLKRTTAWSEFGQQDKEFVDLAAAKKANLLLFQDRRSELENDLKDQKITQTEFTELARELEKTLLSDISETAVASPRKPSKFRTMGLAVLSLVGIPLVSVLMYDRLGSYQPLQQAQWTEETREVLAESGGDVGEMLQRLEEKLVINPRHVEGWILLGRSYLSMQRYPEASRAFEQLITQLNAQGENPAAAYGLLAQSIYFATGMVSPGVQSALNKALAADPNEGNALSLLGIAAFQEQRYEDAIGHWQQILAANPNDSNVDALRAGVLRAQQLIAIRDGLASAAGAEQPVPGQNIAGNDQNISGNDNVPAVDPIVENEETAANNTATANEKVPAASIAQLPIELQVRVTLPDDLNGKVEPEDTLFILARPVGGRMPLAVTRRSAGELPVTVTLNDSMAMGPMVKLSTAEQVEVVARISKSGTPQAQPGDIEGSSGPIVLRQQEAIVPLILNNVIR